MDDVTLNILEDMVDYRMRKPIVLKEFLAEYKQALEGDILPQTEDDIKTAIKLNDDLASFESVAEKCSLTHLMQPDDASIVEFLPGQTEAKRAQPLESPAGAENLSTYKSLKQHQVNNARNPFRRTTESFKLAPFPNDNDAAQTIDEPICDYYNDLLLSVRIYRPSRASHIGRDLEKPVFAENFHCLGSNFLTELRDKISCLCNKYHFYDISDNPDADTLPEKQTDPGFLFIGDTFYNDKRNAKNADYSEVLLKWVKHAKGIKDAKFKTAKMEETRFIDLTISLGFPQLYQHHGNCEHLFTFSQVEILTPTLTFHKPVPRNSYPHLHSFCVFNNRLCNMCGSAHYMFIVEQSDRQLHDPAYLCSRCFYAFHYVDGKKIGNFKAYKIQSYNASAGVILNEATEESISYNDSIEEELDTKTREDTQKIAESKDNTFRITVEPNNIDIVIVNEEQNVL